MTTMIERVARAMVAADSGPEGSVLFDMHWAEFGDGYLKTARAAIAAMRDPTEGMLDGINPNWIDGGAVQSYQAMIDAALEEKP